MKKINLDQWYVKGDDLRITLPNFRVKIIQTTNNICYLKIKDKDNNETILYSKSLEDAIYITENIINESIDTKEIEKKYKEYTKKEKTINVVELTPLEVKEAIINHYSKGHNYKVSVQEELYIRTERLRINFYITKHIDYYGTKKEITTRLTKEDLNTCLNEYMDTYNYEVTDFKPIGGIDREGYFIDENTPHYDGIQLHVKKKKKSKTLKLDK